MVSAFPTRSRIKCMKCLPLGFIHSILCPPSSSWLGKKQQIPFVAQAISANYGSMLFLPPQRTDHHQTNLFSNPEVWATQSSQRNLPKPLWGLLLCAPHFNFDTSNCNVFIIQNHIWQVRSVSYTVTQTPMTRCHHKGVYPHTKYICQVIAKMQWESSAI